MADKSKEILKTNPEKPYIEDSTNKETGKNKPKPVSIYLNFHD